MTVPTSYHASLDDQNAAGQARHMVRNACGSWPTPRVEDAELLVTELVANALIHDHGDVNLRISADPELLHVDVMDGSPTPPSMVAAAPSPDNEHGRGLHIVDTVADSWGTATGPDLNGKTVWFELHRDDA